MLAILKTFWKPLIWLLIICYLSLTPSKNLPPMPKLFEFDKIGHFVLYFTFSILLTKSLLLNLSKSFNEKKVKMLVAVISIIIGTAIEILQATMVYNRHGDIYDLTADIFGTILGLVLYNFIAKRFYRFI